MTYLLAECAGALLVLALVVYGLYRRYRRHHPRKPGWTGGYTNNIYADNPDGSRNYPY